jgi:hypothetical protein
VDECQAVGLISHNTKEAWLAVVHMHPSEVELVLRACSHFNGAYQQYQMWEKKKKKGWIFTAQS